MTRIREPRTAPARTLMQVLIAVAATGLLGTLATFGVVRAREQARARACLAILGEYGDALAAYAADFGVLPYENVGDEALGHQVWRDAIATAFDGPPPLCPSVSPAASNAVECYRINSKLGRLSGPSAAPYRALSTLSRSGSTVVLFDAEYGGVKLSLKGRLKDVQYRHLGQAHLLMADWQVQAFDAAALKAACAWLPPKIIWDPDGP